MSARLLRRLTGTVAGSVVLLVLGQLAAVAAAPTLIRRDQPHLHGQLPDLPRTAPVRGPYRSYANRPSVHGRRF